MSALRKAAEAVIEQLKGTWVSESDPVAQDLKAALGYPRKGEHMTDRELLELAAKAAGYVLGKHTQKDWAFTYGGVEWNPITDDGDALRLAVTLGLRVHKTTSSVEIDIYKDGAWADTVVEKIEHDPLAATRRAIVRAAAEIGRSMT